MKKYEHLTAGHMLPQFTTWANIIQNGQNGNLHFLPHTGLMYRVNQFVDWFQTSSDNKLKLIDLDLDLAGEAESLRATLDLHTGPILLVERRNLLSTDGYRLALAIQNAGLRNPRGILIVHECSPIELHRSTDWPSIIYSNVFLYSLPDHSAITEYIRNIARDWEIPLTNLEIKSIIGICGNQLWLINEMIRLRQELPGVPINTFTSNNNFLRKCSILWESYPELYRQLWTRTLGDARIASHLDLEIQSFGIRPADPWLRRLIQDNVKTMLIISPDLIKFHETDFTREFSAAERRVLSILSSTPEVVNRENIGNNFWLGNAKSGEFSDWALDQMISRLRKKLKKFNLPIAIKTKRGMGYVYTRSAG